MSNYKKLMAILEKNKVNEEDADFILKHFDLVEVIEKELLKLTK